MRAITRPRLSSLLLVSTVLGLGVVPRSARTQQGPLALAGYPPAVESSYEAGHLTRPEHET
jgi:hypothetical protein